MNLTLILTILGKISPVLLPTVFNDYILILIPVLIYLFWHLSLQYIHWYLTNKTQTTKYRETHTSFKHSRFFNIRIPINGKKIQIFIIRECLILDHPSKSLTPLSRKKCWSKQELIYFFCTYSNLTNNIFFTTIYCKHTTTSFLILLILPSLISPPYLQHLTSQKTPPRFFLDPLLIHHLLWNYENRWAHGVLGVGGRWSIAVANIKCYVDFLVWRVIPKKKPTKNRPGIEN